MQINTDLTRRRKTWSGHGDQPPRPSGGLTGQGWQEGPQHRSQLDEHLSHLQGKQPTKTHGIWCHQQRMGGQAHTRPQATRRPPAPLSPVPNSGPPCSSVNIATPLAIKEQVEHPLGPQPVSRCCPPAGAPFEQRDTACKGTQPRRTEPVAPRQLGVCRWPPVRAVVQASHPQAVSWAPVESPVGHFLPCLQIQAPS